MNEFNISIMQKLISDLGGNVTSNQDLIGIDEAELNRILELFKQIEQIYSQIGENTTPEQIDKLEEELDVKIGLQGTYYVEIISDKVSEKTEIFVPDAQGNSSIQELLDALGAGAGI